MKNIKKLQTVLLGFLIIFAPMKAWAIYSYCNIGPVSQGYNTIYHQAGWSSYDVNDYYDYVLVHTELTAPISTSSDKYYEAQTGATVTVYLQNPDNGYAAGSGFIDLGAYAWADCSEDGYIDNTPSVNVWITNNPAVQGESVTVNHSASNNPSSCTRNGSPVSSSGQTSFTASLSNAGTYEVSCTGPLGHVGGDSEVLVVWECGDNSPYFVPPLPSTGPNIDYQSLVDGGANWGETQINYLEWAECEQICFNHEYFHRLEGDLPTSPTSYIRVSTQIPAVDQCTATSRTQSNIDHTLNHELVHENAMLTVINNAKFGLGASYETKEDCEIAEDALLAQLVTNYNNELAVQKNHEDHAGEPRHIALCEAVNQPTSECSCPR